MPNTNGTASAAAIGALNNRMPISRLMPPRMNDPALDKLVRTLRSTLEPVARATSGTAVARYVSEHSYALPVVELNGAVAIGKGVRDWPQQVAQPYAGPWWDLRAN